MSGIMAIVSLDGRPVPPELPRAQLAAIAHRGEWEPRLWEAPGIALGHVNLPRTPEAERELLPASDPSGRYWITWDGRLDNRDELATKLDYDVAQRTDKTDADYVLDAFIKWGDDCVHHLLGDWAVVVWDSQTRRLFCAKDPIGWRQLYYAEHDGLLAVGSEPQQFFAGGWLPEEPDWEYLRQFLNDSVRSLNGTGYEGLGSLQGGQRFSSVVPDAETFWSAPHVKLSRRRRVEETVEQFTDIFAVALACRLRTNKPVGVFLSGGLDSSYIAALAAQRTDIKCISAFVPNSRFDERLYVEALEAHVSLKVQYFDASDCWALSSRWLKPRHFDRMDMPAQAAYYILLGEAARGAGLGVMLGGEGADEMHMGYPTFARTLTEGSVTGAWRLSASNGTSARRRAGYLFREFQAECLPAAAVKQLPERYQISLPAIIRPIIASPPGLRSMLEGGPSLRPWVRTTDGWRTYRLTADTTVGWRERHALTPFGIEQRAPFFDLRVVEMMASVPEWQKSLRGRFKAILREAERGVVPDLITNRPDKGTFTAPLVDGLVRSEAARFKQGIDALAASRAGLTCDAEELLRRWSSRTLERELAWRAATSGLWLQHGFNGPGDVTSSVRELVSQGRG